MHLSDVLPHLIAIHRSVNAALQLVYSPTPRDSTLLPNAEILNRDLTLESQSCGKEFWKEKKDLHFPLASVFWVIIEQFICLGLFTFSI